jgi:hypothetical protein
MFAEESENVTSAVTFWQFSNLLRELVGQQPDDVEPLMKPELGRPPADSGIQVHSYMNLDTQEVVEPTWKIQGVN